MKEIKLTKDVLIEGKILKEGATIKVLEEKTAEKKLIRVDIRAGRLIVSGVEHNKIFTMLNNIGNPPEFKIKGSKIYYQLADEIKSKKYNLRGKFPDYIEIELYEGDTLITINDEDLNNYESLKRIVRLLWYVMARDYFGYTLTSDDMKYIEKN